ncbi:hypothetical protein ADL28_10925 [Streptomyces violaceusniger]|uniref:Uncharacterized protein n=2 Tax=Streptomyces violaceusniger group TaxID=2839105 RepID=A0ABD5JNH2_9ACTN|nr:hypothetical protein [Streptomyces violaceusniger]KUL63147.1 hypothetical protein ADL28_10925 [Streptomyces violaceusniger]MEE4589262.1 hypothetical protein [Streptomyces sp. DSM 41602]
MRLLFVVGAGSAVCGVTEREERMAAEGYELSAEVGADLCQDYEARFEEGSRTVVAGIEATLAPTGSREGALEGPSWLGGSLIVTSDTMAGLDQSWHSTGDQASDNVVRRSRVPPTDVELTA